MRKTILTFMVSCWLVQGFGQSSKKISLNLEGQYNSTISDATKGNNPWGIGLGLQAYYNNRTKFKPTLELTGDVYMADDKVLRMYTDGAPLNSVGGMINLFAGLSYQPVKPVFISMVAGSSFVSGQTLFGIKPSLGFYFSPKQKWSAKLSYINIFNREPRTGEDFRSLSVALGLRLF